MEFELYMHPYNKQENKMMVVTFGAYNFSIVRYTIEVKYFKGVQLKN